MLDELKEEEIVNKVGGRFKLSTLIQKRMIMLNTGARPLVDVRGDKADKMAIVIQEILQDKIYLDASEELQTRGDKAGDPARRAMMGDISGTSAAATIDMAADANLPTAGEPQPYQPLSLLAVAAFGLTAAYTGLVVLFGLFDLLAHTPWLLPLWLLPLPVLLAALALVARFQVRRSENTLSGLALTSWAIGLCAGVGIVSTMVYFGTFLAVRAQAQAFATDWIRNIANVKVRVDGARVLVENKTVEAFFESLRPPRRIVRGPDDTSDQAALRRHLELTQNTSRRGEGGALSIFGAADYVRLLQFVESDGPRVEFTGVQDWDYENRGFTVSLSYRISTDLASFPLIVTVRGLESPNHEYVGRQWYVLLDKTGIPGARSALERTPLGEQLSRHEAAATRAADSGIKALRNGSFDGAIWREEGFFWTDERLRPDVERALKPLSSHERPAQPREVEWQPANMPTMVRAGGNFYFGYDLRMLLPTGDQSNPVVIVEGRLIVRAELTRLLDEPGRPAGAPGAALWKVEGLELVRARSAPKPAEPVGSGPKPKAGQ